MNTAVWMKNRAKAPDIVASKACTLMPTNFSACLALTSLSRLNPRFGPVSFVLAVVVGNDVKVDVGTMVLILAIVVRAPLGSLVV